MNNKLTAKQLAAMRRKVVRLFDTCTYGETDFATKTVRFDFNRSVTLTGVMGKLALEESNRRFREQEREDRIAIRRTKLLCKRSSKYRALVNEMRSRIGAEPIKA